MKKSVVFTLAILISVSIQLSGDAKKKRTGLVVSFGNTVNNKVKRGVSKNVKGGFYGKSTLDQAEEAPKGSPTPTPSPSPSSLTTGEPLNPSLIRKNQNKEDNVASGILLFNSDKYEKAAGEFKKAQSIGNDPIVQRWLDVTNNRQKIKEIESLIDEYNATEKLKNK